MATKLAPNAIAGLPTPLIDLNPFKKINPCGIENLEMVNIDDINKNINMTNIINEITPYLTKHLRYDIVENLKVDNI